jgi:hypothetical protein
MKLYGVKGSYRFAPQLLYLLLLFTIYSFTIYKCFASRYLTTKFTKVTQSCFQLFCVANCKSYFIYNLIIYYLQLRR